MDHDHACNRIGNLFQKQTGSDRYGRQRRSGPHQVRYTTGQKPIDARGVSLPWLRSYSVSRRFISFFSSRPSSPRVHGQGLPWQRHAGAFCSPSSWARSISTKPMGVAAVIVGPILVTYVTSFLGGAATTAILIVTSTSLRSPPAWFAIALAAAVTSPPCTTMAIIRIGEYQRAGEREAYDDLPSALTLPATPNCEPYRTSGPIFDVEITPRDRYGNVSHNGGSRVRFPAHYNPPPNVKRLPDPTPFQVDFLLRLSDGKPVGQSDLRNADGKPIPVAEREPFVAISLRPLGQQPPASLQCDTSLRDRCQYSFRHNGLGVWGTFREADRSLWPEIQSRVEQFTDCVTQDALTTG